MTDQPKQRSRRRNYFQAGIVQTCDECAKVPEDKVLWRDRYRWLWCTTCWPYYKSGVDI